jgi:hypothetical protein
MEGMARPSEPWQEGYLAVRHLGDGVWLLLAPLTYGRVRLNIGDRGSVYNGW